MVIEDTEQQKTEEEMPELSEETVEEEAPIEEEVKEVTPAEVEPAKEEAVEEEVKPKKKEEEEEIVEERTYTIPLSRALVRPPKKRAPRAMQLIKIFITKHMKLEMKVSEEEEEEELPHLIISQEVNQKV